MKYSLYSNLCCVCIDFKPFNDWCSEYSWLVTFISIIASGIVSLIISRHYYIKANRDVALASIVERINTIISKTINKDNKIEFEILKNLYAMRFLNKNERACINNLYESYAALVGYDKDVVVADAIVNLFHTVLINNSIDINIEPLDYENFDLGYKIPNEAERMLHECIVVNLKKWADYELDDSIDDKINCLLNSTSKKVFSTKNSINYFSEMSFEEVVERYTNDKWGERFNTYYSNREVFRKTFSTIGGTSK